MKVIKPRIYIPLSEVSEKKLLKIERYARVCYKSEDQIKKGSSNAFIKNIISSGHESVIEHEKATVLIITDRGITHEIVRHRIGSYSQESTRYCNYSKNKFGKEITVINPFFFDDNQLKHWENSCLFNEETYFMLLNCGLPEEARAVLPNSLKTEIVITYNFREWRHFFKLRCSRAAHPQMRQISIPLLVKFREFLPCLFEDILYDNDFPINNFAEIFLTDDFFNPITDLT